jgi:protease-4
MDEVQTGGIFGQKLRLVERVERELAEAAKDEAVKAVLLAVDSPGGGVTASDQIWKAIVDFKERSKKPVVVHMGALCASGGYYISAPSDWIVCEPTSITGSIGVIMSTFNLSGLVQKFDVKPITIKAGANKDLLNAFEPVNPAHIEILQKMIDEAYELFVKRVSEGRGGRIKVPEVKSLCDGAVFSGRAALEVGLVDELGYRKDALKKARELAKIEEATLFRYTRQPSFFDALSGDVEAGAAAGPLGVDLSLEGLTSLETPRLMYLWRPSGR